jgi:hypothetical protein
MIARCPLGLKAGATWRRPNWLQFAHPEAARVQTVKPRGEVTADFCASATAAKIGFRNPTGQRQAARTD